jgi:hypothetical protein
LDFGDLEDWGINGLIGLDILMNGKFIVDLEKLELLQRKNKTLKMANHQHPMCCHIDSRHVECVAQLILKEGN